MTWVYAGEKVMVVTSGEQAHWGHGCYMFQIVCVRRSYGNSVDCVGVSGNHMMPQTLSVDEVVPIRSE